MEVKRKRKIMEEINEINEKSSALKEAEIRNTILVIKERKSYEELQEAREELMKGLGDISDDRRSIGVKRVGEADVKPFLNACKQRFSNSDETMFQFAMLFSKWQSNLNDLSWIPFKLVEEEDGTTKDVVDEEDEKLKNLRDEWGEEVKDAIKTALEEMIEFDPNGRDSIPTLWDFKHGRKATLKEGITFLLQHIKTLEHKKT